MTLRDVLAGGGMSVAAEYLALAPLLAAGLFAMHGGWLGVAGALAAAWLCGRWGRWPQKVW